MIRMELSNTGKQADPRTLRRLQLALEVAEETARVIRKRAWRGRFATPAKPYAGPAPAAAGKRRRVYRVAADYAQDAGADKTVFASSADFHRSVGAVPGNTTGALWDGLRTRNFGTAGAVIEFGGSSKSARAGWKRKTVTERDSVEVAVSQTGKVSVKRRKRVVTNDKGQWQMRRADSVQNRIKAAAVFRTMGVGLLQPTEAEAQAQVSAVAAVTGEAVAAVFGTTAVFTGQQGDAALFRAITQRGRQA